MPGPCRQASDIQNSLTQLVYWAIIAMKGGSLVLYVLSQLAGMVLLVLAPSVWHCCSPALIIRVHVLGKSGSQLCRRCLGGATEAQAPMPWACTQMSAAMVWRVWRHVFGTAVPALLWDSWAGGCLKTLLHAQGCLSAAPQPGRLLCQAPAGT